MKAEQQYVTAKTSVWWDIENCPVPKGCDTHAIAQNISSALAKLNYNGPVSISAYGDTTRFPSAVQQALSSTGIALNHVPSGVKDASDKKILVDMLFWAVDNPPPANYLLISGDRDFSNALHQLRLRRYNILLAQPQKASAPLLAAAKTVWLWSSLLAGGPPNHPNFHQQKSTPVKNKPSVCHDKKNKSPSVLECQSTSSAPSSPDIPSNDTWGTPVHTKPAKYIQLRVKVVLLALDALKNEKIMPTQSNIADCIRYGDPKHRNTDVRKGLECAVEQQMIVQQNRGTVQFYVRKNENLWECVDPLGGNANEYPKTTWTEIKSFLTSSTGRSAVLASQCRYEAGTIIKRLCLKQLALGEVLQILNMTITAKRWIMHHESGWQPLKIFLAAANTSIPEDQPSTSSAPSADIPDNGTSGFPGCPKPSECMQGPVEAILLTLDTLKNEQIMPTEANIADCIQYGDPKHQNIDVRKGLESALEQQKIVQQNVGTVQLYIGKNEEMWKCVDPFNCNANVYPKAIWTEIKNFLTSSIGRSAILASQCRYEAGTIIKRLCFKQLPLGEVLRILNMTITVKRWIIHHQSGWQPLKIVLAAGAPPLSRKRKADCSCEGQY